MFVEKYRPKSFDTVVGRDEIVAQLKKFLAQPEGLPHILFFGPPGTGKTLMAEVIANEIFGADKPSHFHEFNASSERGIDVVRDQIIKLASVKPMKFPYKIILMDESDHITGDAQAAFRRPIEMYQKHTRFIFTANYPYKLIEPVRDRFLQLELTKIDPMVIAKFLKKICKLENKQVDDKDLIAIAKRTGGAFRSALNMLEGIDKSLDEEIWSSITLKKLQEMSREERIALAFKGDPDVIFLGIWEFVKREKAWDLLTALADTQAKMNFSAQKTIFLANFLDKLGSK